MGAMVPPVPGGAPGGGGPAGDPGSLDMAAMAGGAMSPAAQGMPTPQQKQQAIMERIHSLEQQIDAITGEMGSGAGQAAQDVKNAIRKWMAAGMGKPQTPEPPTPQGMA